MIIGIDAREIQRGTRTGIGRALCAFLEWFDTGAEGDTCILFTSAPMALPWRDRVSNVIAPERVRVVWDQITLARLCRTHRIDVLYSPYYKVPLAAPCPVVSTIMDVMYLTFPPYRRAMSRMARVYYAVMGRLFALRAAGILTCSRYSAREISAVYAVPAKKLRIIPLGVSAVYAPAGDDVRVPQTPAPHGITGDYILYCGNFRAHKNVGALITAFMEIHTQYPDLRLVLAGHLDKDALFLRDKVAAMPCALKVIFTGGVSQEDQIALYQGARVLVMPSLHEGFGYPVLEAMACGTPVVCSSAGSLPEVAGNAALMADPREQGALAVAIRRVLDSAELAGELRRKGVAQAAGFSIEGYGPQVYALLRECAVSGRRRS